MLLVRRNRPQCVGDALRHFAPCRPGLLTENLIAGELDEPGLRGVRPAACQLDHIRLRGLRRKRKHFVQRTGIESGRSSESKGRVYVRCNDHGAPLLECRPHFPPQPVREVRRIKQNQRAG